MEQTICYLLKTDDKTQIIKSFDASDVTFIPRIKDKVVFEDENKQAQIYEVIDSHYSLDDNYGIDIYIVHISSIVEYMKKGFTGQQAEFW